MEMQRGPWEDYARPATPRIVVPTQAPPRTPDQARIERGNAEAAPLEADDVEAGHLVALGAGVQRALG